MKSLLRACAALVFALLIVPAMFAGHPAPSKGHARSHKPASKKKASTAKADPATASEPASAATAQGAGKAMKASSNPPEAPRWIPMPSTKGGLGFFTLETAETLPKKGMSFSGFGNKISRLPGDITVLTLGVSYGLGLTDRLSVYIEMDAHNHVHADNPSRLSLDTPSTGAFQQFDKTIYRSILPCSPPSLPCHAPAYVEDYPFAFANGGGVGNVTAGVKFNLLSETRGNPLSMSLRNDFIIPTQTSLTDLFNVQAQNGQFNDTVGLAISKHMLRNSMVATFNGAYRFERDATFTGTNVQTGASQTVHVKMADQVQVGAGFLMFPEKRFQVISEYNGIIFVGDHTPNTTFGPRDPVDSVSGVRIYPARWFGIDLGYRYMVNLTPHKDRNGFVIKAGTVVWPEKPRAPDVVTASCSADSTSVAADSGELVAASVRATDSYNHPLNYIWTATGGKVVGMGPDVRWNSAGVGPGTYTITVRVEDALGNNSSCSENVRVEAKPIPPPTISCSVDRSSVLMGERVQVSANASDQSGTPLTYTWQTNGGQIIGSGASVQLDTTGVAPGNYTVTGRVQNGKGGAADCAANVAVQAPPPPPQASKINECLFRGTSSRVDNVCKRILDDIALRLQNDPKAKVAIVGYSAPATGRQAERRAVELAKGRAENAKKYLSQTGVAETRLDVRSASGQKGAGKENNRVDVIWVPEGASY
jgi:outer membrane protein OmpA-like peptidoglycan-associated protein